VVEEDYLVNTLLPKNLTIIHVKRQKTKTKSYLFGGV